MSEITFADALRLARRWWWVLLLCPMLAAGGAYLFSSTITPLYRSEVRLLIDTSQASSTSNYNDLLAAERLTRTYSQLVTTRAVMEETIVRLNGDTTVDDLREIVEVSTVSDTQLLAIAVTDPDPAAAALIANTIGDVFTEHIRDQRLTAADPEADELTRNIDEVRAQIDETAIRISELEASPFADSEVVQTEIRQLRTLLSTYQTTYGGLLEIRQRLSLSGAESQVRLYVADPATAPNAPVSPRKLINTALAGVLGVVIATGLVVVLGYVDNTVKTPEDVQRLTGKAAIGLIPQLRSPDAIEPIANPRSPATEAYRGLRTNLQFATVGKSAKTFLVTSAGPSEGKSTTVMNLGVVLAQSGQRVILVDADLRRPRLHKLGGLHNRAGLTNMLIADAGSELFLYGQKTDVPSLLVVPTGPLPPNPADVLNSPRMGEIIRQLEARADIVLIDTPPMVFSDAQIVSGLVDGCLVVAQAGKTRASELRSTVEGLNQIGSSIYGIIVNRVNFGRAEYRRYEYYTTYYNVDPETTPLVGGAFGPLTRKRLSWFPIRRASSAGDAER
jgi:polysaccharide biosynthesis transport protein